MTNIADRFVNAPLHVNSNLVLFGYPNNIEFSLLQHSIERSFAITEATAITLMMLPAITFS